MNKRVLVRFLAVGVLVGLTATRALAGMQKEALVSDGRNGECWRMFCDEGPWLNGTD